MADSHTTKLCTQIVATTFGPLAAKVTSALLVYGRLTLGQIIRYSSLRSRTSRACILVLIQHNLIWHVQSEEDGEVLEFNSEECLLRLRYGTFVWQTERLFGESGREIVSVILDNGKLKPPDILRKLALVIGDDKSQYKKTIQKLIAGAYIVPSTVMSHASPHDKLMQYENDETRKFKNFPTAKELREAKERAEARLKREQEAAMKVDVVDEAYFRVNPSKFNIHIRNKIIEAAVRERFNDSAASVMRATLKATETKQISLADPNSDPTSVATVSTHLSDDDDIIAGLAYPSKERPTTMTALKDLLGILSSADNPTPAGRAGSFLTFGSGSSKVFVEFELICRRLRRRVYEAVVREGHGDEGVRLVRLLIESGKMNGDQLAKAAMMTANSVRTLLASLAEETLVSIQEVPKGADRNPQRTFYLWYVDLDKAYSVILGKMYKTLYNIAVRREAEEQEPTLKAVLEKCKRSDVQEDDSLLTRMEKDVLQVWEEKKEKLTVLEMRVEETVFLLRDLAVFGTGDK